MVVKRAKPLVNSVCVGNFDQGDTFRQGDNIFLVLGSCIGCGGKGLEGLVCVDIENGEQAIFGEEEIVVSVDLEVGIS